MPIRIGFGQHRSQLLRYELDRVAEELPGLGAVKVILTGDLARERTLPSSILQLVIVHETEAPYLERIDFFTSHLRPLVGIDISVYTPTEFTELESTSPFVIDALENGSVIYER